jgi:hypothetical protein
MVHFPRFATFSSSGHYIFQHRSNNRRWKEPAGQCLYAPREASSLKENEGSAPEGGGGNAPDSDSSAGSASGPASSQPHFPCLSQLHQHKLYHQILPQCHYVREEVFSRILVAAV